MGTPRKFKQFLVNHESTGELVQEDQCQSSQGANKAGAYQTTMTKRPVN